ncbi:MAG: ROK family protein [Bacteroidetes bacterium]|nr:ROK family protein [Bacteroidota bacterium]MBL6943837.1 ROK family protein [Bacteroidales bacterium]
MKQSSNIILTLDAGGTNLVFNAIDAQNNISADTVLPASSKTLDEFLQKLLSGFHTINQKTGNKANAISFCFPGPANYQNGIIGDLENLPFFKGGVALKPMLEREFKLPVYINNDGDLFTLGEAINGLLPLINTALKENGNTKQYRNLLGITLGTGTGGGIIINGELLIGDNSAGAEINRSNNFLNPEMSIEETLSIRGIKHLYCEASGIEPDLCPEPTEIFEIGTGQRKGNTEAAIKAWETFGVVLGQTLANAITLIDGLIVIGGGLSGAHSLFLPKAIEEMNGSFRKLNGETVQRLETFAYNFENPDCMRDFLQHDEVRIDVPYSNDNVSYSSIKKVGVGISRLGTSNAVAVGAFEFANKKISG